MDEGREHSQLGQFSLRNSSGRLSPSFTSHWQTPLQGELRTVFRAVLIAAAPILGLCEKAGGEDEC